MPTSKPLLKSIAKKGAKLAAKSSPRSGRKSLSELCTELNSTQGEASGVALASQALDCYASLEAEERTAFFVDLANQYNPDPDRVTAAAANYAREASASTLAELMATAEPPRQELFRRLNFAPGGTAALVSLRNDLLKVMREEPILKRIDLDLFHLLGSWFNRGFLELHRIDWSAPASLLEKIVQYEAVHEISDWGDLRRRLLPRDRRCFGFFHPSMPEDPLIFVEVALTRKVPEFIDDLLHKNRQEMEAENATTAVFYSISNCQSGLRGISFGNFLIKQVAYDLSRELPNLKTFITLSPLPRFVTWLRQQAEASEDAAALEAAAIISSSGWDDRPESIARLDQLLEPLAIEYLVRSRRPDQHPIDPVARFHLGNGAILDRVNLRADLSKRGLANSAGVMVNYRYDLDRIEENHEAYARGNEVRVSPDIQKLLQQPRTDDDIGEKL